VGRGESVLVEDLAAGGLLALELVAVEVGNPFSVWAAVVPAAPTIPTIKIAAAMACCVPPSNPSM
jgi:hypothetical protein